MLKKKLIKKKLVVQKTSPPSMTAANKDAMRERRILDVLVEDLMGKDPAKRFAFIMANAKFVKKEDLDF